MIEEPLPDEWWMDLQPPTRMPEESVTIFATELSLPGYLDEMREKIKRFLEKYTLPVPRKKPCIQLGDLNTGRYPHDKPTNLIYPTSYDSWYNEYVVPQVKSSDHRTLISHHRIRRR